MQAGDSYRRALGHHPRKPVRGGGDIGAAGHALAARLGGCKIGGCECMRRRGCMVMPAGRGSHCCGDASVAPCAGHAASSCGCAGALLRAGRAWTARRWVCSAGLGAPSAGRASEHIFKIVFRKNVNYIVLYNRFENNGLKFTATFRIVCVRAKRQRASSGGTRHSTRERRGPRPPQLAPCSFG